MSYVLESLAQHDKRIARERMWREFWKWAEWIVSMLLVAAISAAIAFAYGTDYGREREQKRVANAPRQGYSCKVARDIARSCFAEDFDSFKTRRK